MVRLLACRGKILWNYLRINPKTKVRREADFCFGSLELTKNENTETMVLVLEAGNF